MPSKNLSTQNVSGMSVDNERSFKARIQISLATISILIENGNEKLWPIFDKLESELIQLEQKEDKLSRYSRV